MIEYNHYNFKEFYYDTSWFNYSYGGIWPMAAITAKDYGLDVAIVEELIE